MSIEKDWNKCEHIFERGKGKRHEKKNNENFACMGNVGFSVWYTDR